MLLIVIHETPHLLKIVFSPQLGRTEGQQDIWPWSGSVRTFKRSYPKGWEIDFQLLVLPKMSFKIQTLVFLF